METRSPSRSASVAIRPEGRHEESTQSPDAGSALPQSAPTPYGPGSWRPARADQSRRRRLSAASGVTDVFELETSVLHYFLLYRCLVHRRAFPLTESIT